jgi:hypothetical protein
MSTKTLSLHTPQAVLDLIPRQQALPDEDPIRLEDLRAAFLAELAPVTAYETSLAEQLVGFEWETQRMRRLKDSLLLQEYYHHAIGVFEFGEIRREALLGQSEETKRLSKALISSDPGQRSEAEQGLVPHDVTPTQILTRAWQQCADDLERFEKQLATLEIRRRRLKADYDQLIALRRSRAQNISDAEVVE